MLLIIVAIVFLVFIIPIIYNIIKIISTRSQQHESYKQLNENRIKRIIISVVLLLIVTSLLFIGNYIITRNIRQDIKQEKFDKTKWAAKQGDEYPYRNNMLHDLVYNKKLKGLTKDELLHLLGEPNRTDSNYLFYTISRTYYGDIPVPFHTKTLVIKLNRDTVEWRKIHE